MPRGIPNNPDEVKTNSDIPESPVDPVMERLNKMDEELNRLRDQNTLLNDRNARLEYAVGNENKMRKWDEMNDPLSKKKRGFVPSFNGKDPIINMERKGEVRRDEQGNTYDEQSVTVTFLEGEPAVVDYMRLNAKASGNSIPCIVENFEEVMAKKREIDDKRKMMQNLRVRNMASRFDTVSMLKEIAEMENKVFYKVTLSEDHGLTWTGKVIDIPEVVFNAIP